MRYLGYFIVLILLILGVTFAVMNSTSVTVNYYLSTSQMPLSLLMAICFGVGVLLGLLVMFFKVMRLQLDRGLLRRKVNKLTQEIKAIHAMTGEDDE